MQSLGTIWGGSILIGFAACTVFLLCQFHDNRCIATIVVGTWVVGVPMFHSLEFWWKQQELDLGDAAERKEFELFKYRQQLSHHVWLGFSGLLVALYLKAPW